MPRTRHERTWLVATIATGISVMPGVPILAGFFGHLVALIAFLIAGSTFGLVFYRAFNGPRTKAPAPPSKSVVEEFTDGKRRRRADEARKWQDQWARILPPSKPAQTIPGYILIAETCSIADIQRLIAIYSAALDYKRSTAGWDGLHHATCPYECDCPQEARAIHHRSAS